MMRECAGRDGRRPAFCGARLAAAGAAAIALLAGSLCAIGPAAIAAPSQATADGAHHVRNGATPTAGVQQMRLRELWRVGGEDGDDVFGMVSQVLLDEQGQIYLLDSQLSQIVVYSQAGKRLRTLGREGDGPGEVRRPSDALLLPDGSVGFVQTFPGKVVKVDRQGAPAGALQPGGASPTQGGFAVLIDGQCRGGQLVFSGIDIGMEEGKQLRRSYLASFGADGKEKARYLEHNTTLDFSKAAIIEKDQYFVYPRRWSLAADGRVCAAPYRNRYALNVYNPDGRLEMVIERAFTSRKRTQVESARVQRILEAQTRQSPIKFTLQAEDTEPDISQVRYHEDGTIWVLHSRSAIDQPAGVFATYDVFDAQGKFDRQVAVQTPGDGENDALFLTDDGHAVLVTGMVEAAMSMQGAGEADSGDGAAPMEVVYLEVLR